MRSCPFLIRKTKAGQPNASEFVAEAVVAVLKNDKFWNYFGKCSRRQHLLLILQVLWVFRQALHFTI